MRSIAFLAAAVLLAGCEISGNIIPAGRDTYMVSSHVALCLGCSAAVQSLKTANAYCAKQGKFVVVRNTSGATNPFGYDNGNQLIFSCVAENDPEYKRPDLRKDNGVTTVESR